MSTDDQRRVLLIGLDGATFSVLDSLMAEGVMPFLRTVAMHGVRAVLHSTPHPLTAPAWTTLSTGRTPGNHGIFDFIRPHRYRGHPGYNMVTSSDVQAESVWSMVARQGLRATALNFVCTYPLPNVAGVRVVPGWMPAQIVKLALKEQALYTQLVAQPAIQVDKLGIDLSEEREAIQEVLEDDLEAWIEQHVERDRQWFEVAKFLMTEEPCHLTTIVFDGVDKLQHHCYHLLDPHLLSPERTAAQAHARQLCLDYFRQLDGWMAELARLAGPEATLFIVSDHGFTACEEQDFYVNTWLEQHGYLAWKEGVPFAERGRIALDDLTEITESFDWSRTTAFAQSSSSNGIFIYQAERPGGPGVSAEAYPAFRDRLIKALLDFTDPQTGQRVVERAMTREEAFMGRHMNQAPDITLTLRDRSFIAILRAETALRPRPSPRNSHHPAGIFLGRGPGLRVGETIPLFSIVHITPTLLYSLGLPVPADLDGVPAVAAYTPDYVKAHPMRTLAPTVTLPRAQGPDSAHPTLSPEEETKIQQHMKALGYLS